MGVKRKRAETPCGNHGDEAQTGEVVAADMPPATKRDHRRKQKRDVAERIDGLGPKAGATAFTIVANRHRPGQHDTTLRKRFAPNATVRWRRLGQQAGLAGVEHDRKQ
jgi:hypothetical protein